ncbi:hypothetical protein Bbelb_034520 [Branchiostoma belcheri]|nr:hypothetical protein Bbelb_034520 [Branchiostoma belcheri]
MEEKDFHPRHADLVMLEGDDFHLPSELDRLDIDFTERFMGDRGLDQLGRGERCDCDGVVDAWAIAQVLQPCTHCVDKMQRANSSCESRGESTSDGHSSARLGNDLSGKLSDEMPANNNSECGDLSSTCPSEEQSSWSETCSGCTLCDAEFDLDLISLLELAHGGSDMACLPDKAISAEEMVASWVQQCTERPSGHPGACFHRHKFGNVLKTMLKKTFLRKVKGRLRRPKQQK